MSNAARAVIDHSFYKHDYCNKSWLYPQLKNYKNKYHLLLKLANGRLSGLLNPPKRPQIHYQAIKKNRTLYNQIWKVYSSCILKHCLEEPLQPYDIQINESLNQSISKYTPQHKLFGSSMALTHQVNITVRIHNLGHLEFWKQVLKET